LQEVVAHQARSVTRNHSRRNSGGRKEVSRMEQELRAAKNSERTVRFSLAVETSFTDENCEVIGIPIEFDNGDVKICSALTKHDVWLLKAFIVAVQVLA
jgi:hypothetical protein